MAAFWHDDWPRAQRLLLDWWEGKGCALCVTAPKDEPWEAIPAPTAPDSLETRWTDPGYRVREAQHWLSQTYFGGAAFPYLDTQIGPGSLGLFLGSNPRFDSATVWYQPWIEHPDVTPPVRFDPSNRWWKVHLDLIDEALRTSAGRYLVGMPDLIENWDTLAQIRDPMELLVDSMDRPAWVLGQIEAINQAFFEAFDLIYNRIRDEQGGNAFAAFQIWGPGRTAKVQCDAAAMLSPEHFKTFVRPALTRQCAWLDYAMFHLDGTQCFPILDALLEIEPLKAVEWTPQALRPGGGSPEWYGLYRRIRTAGKSVQAIGVLPEEVLPLIDAVGHEGIFISVNCESEAEARALERAVYG